MRKPRDIDAELKALQNRQKQLRAKRITQLGELVSATGAAEDCDAETLAGVLLEAVERLRNEPSAEEAWRQRGQDFFRRERRRRTRASAEPAPGAPDQHPGAEADASRAAAE